MSSTTTLYPRGTIIYCDRVKHYIEESVVEVDNAIRYGSDSRLINAEDDPILWRMTDAPPGFMKVTPQDDAGFALTLAVDKIGSYQVHWTDDESKSIARFSR